jgi:hypothetical protein
MGYVHDTHMSQFIPPKAIAKSAGTWTPTIASSLISDIRGATDATFELFIPIELPSNASDLKGCLLKSIDVWYRISTAAADDVATVELEKITLKANGTIPAGEAVSVTLDVDNDTAAERKASAYHKMTVTLDTPVWIDNDEAFVLYILVDAAATTVFTLYGARANYTLRM